MKYVAFLDILGFKDRLKKMSQVEAGEYIASFSSLVYSEFSMSKRNLVNGYIVSDSIILYTNSNGEKELIELINLVDSICKKEFAEKGILIRGAISKGDFDKLPAEELPHLQKELIVGQAYVDAYLMEGSVKTLGIVLSEDVSADLRNCNMGENIVEEQNDNTTQYVYRYLSVEFFMDEKNLQEYVRLAVESSWLPHYYNTLYFTMKNEENDKKVDSIFINIIKILQDNYDWRTLDLFIKNSFGEKVFSRYQTRFLRYLRNNMLK